MMNETKRRIVAAIDDIFFASKVRAAAAHLGVTLELVKSREAALAAVARAPTDLVIADLHAERCEPFALARALKSVAATREIPLLGFFSHVQIELKERAEAAGFDRVLPRSAFSNRLGEILGGARE